MSELLQVDTDYYWRINELKNYIYCPRIAYYALCLGLDRNTAVAQAGIENEAEAKQRMKRRKHALHSVHEGVRQFDVMVVNHEFQYLGKVDEVVETESGVYLVDYKDTERDYGYWKPQMCAYKLAVEASNKTVLGCYIYVIPEKCYQEVEIRPRDQTSIIKVLREIQQMVAAEICPPPTPHWKKCQTCQFERFCNDVL